ncbi:DUF4336 domain-containing protein [Yoonia sp. 208BN28-4]|uniref:DUF4336 domain-containing protein n=1 Tax=Yoonia sp. 208BN28-4 TaxID=3126505 RepID=UPI0030B7497A
MTETTTVQQSGLVPFGPDIWVSDGPKVRGAAGFCFPTRMVVVRLPDTGGLWVWSPVALTPDLQTQIDALGSVAHLIAPNHLHYTFLANWARAYPCAVVHAAPRLTDDTAGTPIHYVLSDRADAAWADVIDQRVVHGNKITTEVVFFHKPSAAVLVTDLIQHMPRDMFSGWRAIVARLDLMTASVPSVPRKFRLATTDKQAARAAVAQILAWPAEKVIMAHGAPVTSGGQQMLQRAFGWLVKDRAT